MRGGVAGVSGLVRAWNLPAGDLLSGGETVLSAGRDESAGRVWVADDDGAVQSLPADAGDVEPLDDLAAVSLTMDRLRRFLTDPPTPYEEAEARRRMDAITGRTDRT